MSKKMTPSIATALANSVSTALVKELKVVKQSAEQNVRDSKEYKQLLKLYKDREELAAKIDQLTDSIQNKYVSGLLTLTIYSDGRFNFYEKHHVSSISDIKDRIIIADYLSNAPITAEDLVQAVVTDIINENEK